jgi:enoyl-CoA hydratase/carnithine racemase
VSISGLDDDLLYEKKGKIAYMTFNRPSEMNSITPKMMEDIDRIGEDFKNDGELLVLIVTGAGEQAFSAGADLKKTITKFKADADSGARFMADPTKRFFAGIYKPIIAAINGFCLAGGTEIIQGMDIRIAAPHAKFGLPEVHWGIIPGGGSHVRLPRQIPYCHAMDILLTGRMITAEEAVQFGLINKIVPADQVMAECENYAETICSNGPLAVQAAKEAALLTYNMGWSEAFSTEAVIAERVFKTDDAAEGPLAFAEKRQPVYQGK